MGEMTIDGLKDIFCNPYYAVQVSDVVATPHQPLIGEKEWVEVFVRNVMETDDGKKLVAPEDIEANLRDALTRMLENLKSNEIPTGYMEA